MSSTERSPDDQLSRSWVANASAWTTAVRGGAIESRRLVTDAAIVNAVHVRAPRNALDVGCGEGWLVRALTGAGIPSVGVDGSKPLIAAARDQGFGVFHPLTYTELAAHPSAAGGPFDAIICNFALLSEDVVPLLASLREIAAPDAALHVQTVHPWSSGRDGPYQDGWRTEHFAGLGDGFSEPMPWYFRTFESWIRTFGRSGWRIESAREPLHPVSGQPLSLILTASATD